MLYLQDVHFQTQYDFVIKCDSWSTGRLLSIEKEIKYIYIYIYNINYFIIILYYLILHCHRYLAIALYKILMSYRTVIVMLMQF
jgi:hypothetical protein